MEYPEISLDTMIDKRDHDKMRFTAKIVEVFGEALTEAAKQIIQLDRGIHWFSVERAPGAPSYLIVQGYTELRPGDVLKVSGVDVFIDERNINDYNNKVTFTVATAMLQTRNAKRLYDHMQFVIQASREAPMGALVEILERGVQSEMELYVEPEHKELLERYTRPRYLAGFSTDELSEDQLQSLQLSLMNQNIHGRSDEA